MANSATDFLNQIDFYLTLDQQKKKLADKF